jgi:hypothetical protein
MKCNDLPLACDMSLAAAVQLALHELHEALAVPATDVRWARRDAAQEAAVQTATKRREGAARFQNIFHVEPLRRRVGKVTTVAVMTSATS